MHIYIYIDSILLYVLVVYVCLCLYIRVYTHIQEVHTGTVAYDLINRVSAGSCVAYGFKKLYCNGRAMWYNLAKSLVGHGLGLLPLTSCICICQ